MYGVKRVLIVPVHYSSITITMKRLLISYTVYNEIEEIEEIKIKPQTREYGRLLGKLLNSEHRNLHCRNQTLCDLKYK